MLLGSIVPAHAQEIVTDQTFRIRTGQTFSNVGVRMLDGSPGTVNAIEQVGSDIYIGGQFDSVASIAASSIARYNTITRTWHRLGNGVQGLVRALEYVNWGAGDGQYLYVGGHFERSGSLHNGLAIWRPDLAAWQDAGGALIPIGFYAGTDPDKTPGVYVIHKVPSGSGSAVYVGGTFDLIERWSGPESRTQEPTVGGLAVFPGPGLSVQPTTFGANNIRALTSMAEPTGDGLTTHALIVGGSFSEVFGGTNAGEEFRNVASYSHASGRWVHLGAGGGPGVPRGLDGTVLTLARNGDLIYAGGRFDTELNDSGTQLNGVAALAYAPGEFIWHGVVNALPNGDQSDVYAIALSGDRLCVGGRLVGREPYDVACYNENGNLSNAGEAVYHAFAGGDGPGLVYALALDGGDLYVGGLFSGVQHRGSGAVRPANSLLTRNLTEATYTTFRQAYGLAGYPTAYAASDVNIYIAGITAVGDDPARGLVVYDPTTRAFTPMTAGVRSSHPLGRVNTMLVNGDTLFVGGLFNEVYDAAWGWKPRRNFAALYLPTQTWLATPTAEERFGATGVTLIQKAGDGHIYVGGDINVRTLGGLLVSGGVVRWRGMGFPFGQLGLGVERTGELGTTINSVAAFADGTLAVAGAFDRLPQPNGQLLYTSNIAWLYPGTEAWTPRRGGTTSSSTSVYGPVTEVFAMTSLGGTGEHVLVGGHRYHPFGNAVPQDSWKTGLLRTRLTGSQGTIFDYTWPGPGVDGAIYYAAQRGDRWIVAGDFQEVFQPDGTGLPVSCMAVLDLFVMRWFEPEYSPGCPEATPRAARLPQGDAYAQSTAGVQAIDPRDYVFLDVAQMSVPVLPVELVAFEAQANGNDVRLAWQTASETNNLGFDVQHGQADGAWRSLAFVPGHGTTTEAYAYEHRVTGLDAGTHRFRLRQTDTDGTIHHSATVTVEVGGDGRLALVHAGSHPTTGPVRVAFTVPDDRPVRLALYDVLGRQVQVLADGAFAPGRHRVEVLPNGLAAGMYLLRLDHPTGQRTLPVVLR